jgi:hypothetical protein
MMPPRKILHYRLHRLTPRRLLEWRKQIAAEPAAAAPLRLRPLRGAAEVSEIEKLRRRWANDPDRQRDRHGQRDQRTVFDEQAQKGLRFQHALRSQS